MIPLLVFLICALCFLITENRINNKANNTYFIFCIILLASMSGFRAQGGTDFDAYQFVYESVPKFPLILITGSSEMMEYEIGYLCYISIYKTLGFSYYGYILLNAFFFYACLWCGLRRYTSHFGFVIIVFLYKLFYYNTFISMRQSVTIALFFIMIHFIEERKYIKYYLFCILAATFHNGALPLFLLYPITFFKLEKRKIIVLNVVFLPTMLLGFAGIDVIGGLGGLLSSSTVNDSVNSKIEGYFGDSENLSPIALFHTLEYLLMMTLVITNYDKLIKSCKHADIVIKLFLCLLPLFTLLRASEILTREKDYFTITYALILGYICSYSTIKRRKNLVFLTLIVCFFGFMRFVLLFDAGAFFDYQSWLFLPKATLID